MKKPLTEVEVYNQISEICKDSIILNRQDINGIWQMNSLLYCLELLDFRHNMHTSINVDISTNNSICIPIRRGKGAPVYIPCKIRTMNVRVVKIEAYLKDDVGEDDPYCYLLIVKEA